MIKKLIKFFIKFSVYLIAFFCLASGYWINKNFDKPSFEQIIYHFQFGSEGLITADISFIKSFTLYCIILPFFASVVAYIIERMMHSKEGRLNDLFIESRITVPLTGILKNCERIAIFIFNARFRFILLVASIIFFLSRISFWPDPAIVKELAQYKNFIDRNYVEPRNIIAPKSKRNLVLIYLESFENAYRNQKLFGRNLLKPLDDATAGWASFSSFLQVDGTGWTAGALVSSQCGVPLRAHFSASTNGNLPGLNGKLFMPGIICLGDILKEAGYTNVFLGGASLSFGGKERFLFSHGYDEAWGREEWTKLGESDMNWWGLYDDRLFFHAKAKLDGLEKAGKPFNLTILTLDTHHPDGFISSECKNQGVRDFQGIVECSSRLVSDFIGYIQSMGYDKRTDIVIIGDHLSLPNKVHDLLLKEPKRTIYNKFYSSREIEPNRQKILHFSIFPTILSMLGFEFESNRLALGMSGFGAADPEYKIATEKRLNIKLNAESEIYKRFWGSI